MQENQMLRPRFNRRLFKKLQDGQAINLVGRRGAGGSRVLQEVSDIAQTDGIGTILVDMNKYKYHYDGFLKELKWQLTGSDQFEAGSATTLLPAAFSKELTSVLSKSTNYSKIFLLLDHFDSILENPDQRFPKVFFDDLNSLRNRRGFSLCCVTEKPHLQYKFYFRDEKEELENTLSWLDLVHEDLPNLLAEEVADELDRLATDYPALSNIKEREKYISSIRGHLHPVDWIKTMLNDFETYTEDQKAEIRINRIGNTYGNRYGNRPKKKMGYIGLLKYLKELSEIWKNFKGK